jgi:hypothetical protein
MKQAYVFIADARQHARHWSALLIASGRRTKISVLAIVCGARLCCLLAGPAPYCRGRYYRYRYHGRYYQYRYPGDYYRHRAWVASVNGRPGYYSYY